jgi:hypothetical protein
VAFIGGLENLKKESKQHSGSKPVAPSPRVYMPAELASTEVMCKLASTEVKPKLASTEVSPKSQKDTPEGLRLCKKCDAFLTMDKFCKNTLGYECRHHNVERVLMRRNDPQRDPTKKMVEMIWNVLLIDAKKVFRKDTVGVTQMEIERFFVLQGIKPTGNLRVMPNDPAEKWGVENINIVTKRVRKVLLSTFSEPGSDTSLKYVRILHVLRT